MKHLLVSRANFSDQVLLKKYLNVSKTVLIPSLKSQTCSNFTWAIITNPESLKTLEESIDFPFVPIFGPSSFPEYAVLNEFNIQTRHDIDDFMADEYIEKIQKKYKSTVKHHSSFLIQAQPSKLFYSTSLEVKMKPYHSKRCSMFLSLCQSDVKNHILERKHGQMYEITEHVVSLGDNYVKWVIHGNNKSHSQKKN